jgi:hypothetical protein
VKLDPKKEVKGGRIAADHWAHSWGEQVASIITQWGAKRTRCLHSERRFRVRGRLECSYQPELL